MTKEEKLIKIFNYFKNKFGLDKSKFIHCINCHGTETIIICHMPDVKYYSGTGYEYLGIYFDEMSGWLLSFYDAKGNSDWKLESGREGESWLDIMEGKKPSKEFLDSIKLDKDQYKQFLKEFYYL